MSISFSGLASGLDTASWIESLVALKRAKVTTLTEQREEVLNAKDALSNIKSFFSAFRSTVEKITSSKFNPVNMSIFTQNIATSADLNVLTAIATHEAKEGTYNIKVDKLATKTNAISNYRKTTTIVEATTATADTRLVDMKVKTGYITVTTKDGSTNYLEITQNDTIATFIEKLKEMGVEANYSERTGVFSLNLGAGAINDNIDNTGILEALHLQNLSSAYATQNALTIKKIESVWTPVTESTKLSELGIGTGTFTIRANDADYDITLGADDTFGDLIEALDNINIEATLDSEGVFTIKDAVITDVGDTDIINKLGFGDGSVYSKTQSSDLLNYQTIVTQITTATTGTKLSELGTGTAISNGDKITIKNSNNELSTITLSETSTIGDVLAGLTNAGLYAAINSDGTIEISGGTVSSTGSFDIMSAFGLEYEPYTAMVNGNPLTETIIEYELVTHDTRLVEDLGVTQGYLEVTNPDDDIFYITISNGQTIGDLMTDLANIGIYSTLNEEEGILEITGGSFRTLDNEHDEAGSLIANNTIAVLDPSIPAQGTNLLECLYGAPAITAEQTGVAAAYSRTRTLKQKVTNTVAATSATRLGTIGLTTAGTAVFNVRGENRTINVTRSMTIEELMSTLEANGIESSWDSDFSRLTINNATLENTGTSNLYDIMNMTSEVSGKYITSDALTSLTTITVSATAATTMAELGVSGNQEVVLNKEDGTSFTFTVSETTNLGTLISTLNSNGVTAKIEDGVFSIDGGYITNAAIEDALDLEHTISGHSKVLGNQMTHTITVTATGNTTLGNIISALGTESEVSGGYNLVFNSHSISVNSTTTINDLMKRIHDVGGKASIDAAGRLHIDGGTLTGTVAEALGFTSTSTTASVSASGDMLYTKEVVYATKDTQLSDLGVNSNITFKVHDHLGNEIATETLTKDKSLGDVFDLLKNTYDIDATIADGVISLTSAEGKYITGDLATHLGIATQTVTDVVNTTTGSTIKVTYTDTLVATEDSLVKDFVDIGNGVVTISNADGVMGSFTIDNTTTFGSLFTKLSSYGINASLKDGIINLESTDGAYATGAVMDALGIGIQTTVSTITTGAHSTAEVTYTDTVYADGKSVIKDFIAAGGNVVLKKSDGTEIATISVTDSMTFDDLIEELKSHGVEATIKDGVVSIEPTTNIDISGSLITALGITKTSTTETTTVGITQTGSLVTNNVTEIADEESLLSDFSITGNLVLNDKNGNSIGVFATEGKTFAEMITYLENNGINASINDGVVSLVSHSGNYVSGAAATALGFGTPSSITITTTVGTTYTGSGTVSYDKTVAVTEADTLDKLGVTSSIEIRIKDKVGGSIITSTTLNSTDTISEMIDYLASYDIEARMQDGKLVVESTGDYVALGYLGGGMTLFSPEYTTVTTIIGNTGTGSLVTYNVEKTADEESKVSDYITVGDLLVNDKNGNQVGSLAVSDTATFADMITFLASHGISASINDGVFTVVSEEGKYISGTVATNLGFGATSEEVNYTVGRTQTGETISYNVVKTLTAESTLADAGASGAVTIYDKATGTQVTVKSDFTTYGDILNFLAEYGIDADINNGVFSVTSENDNYATIASTLKLGTFEVDTTTTTITSGTSITGDTIIYQELVAADEESEVSDYITVGDLLVNDKNGNQVGSLAVSDTATFADMITFLAGHGISASINDGVFSAVSTNGNYISGTVAENLGFGATSEEKDYTLAVSQSGDTVTYTVSETADEESKVSDYITVGDLLVNDENGNQVGSLAVSDTATFADMITFLAEHGISASINDGVFSAVSTNGNYISGTVAENLGFGATSEEKDYTLAVSQSGDTVTYEVERTLTAETTLEEAGASGAVTIYDKTTGTQIDSKSDFTTYSEILSYLAEYGINADINNGVFSVNSENFGFYAVYSDSLNLGTIDPDEYDTTTTVGCSLTGSTVTYNITETNPISLTDTISDVIPEITTIVFDIKDKNGDIIYTSNGDATTFEELFDEWAEYGINATLSDGYISVTSPHGNYLSGPVPNLLGIGTYTYTIQYTNDCVGNITTINENNTTTIDVEVYDSLGNEINSICVGSGEEINYSEIISFFDSCGVDLIHNADGSWGLQTNGRRIRDFGYLFEELGITITNTTETRTTNDISNQFTKTETVTKTMNSDTTLDELGIITGEYITIVSGGTEISIYSDANDTVGNLCTALAGAGISAYVSEGCLILQPSGNSYIKDENFLTQLGISASDELYTTTTTTTRSNLGAGDMLTYSVTETMTSDTTLGEICGYGGIIKIGTKNSSELIELELNPINTVGDVLAALAAYGIAAQLCSDGSIYLAGASEFNATNPAYIAADDDGLLAALGLQVGEGEGKTYESLTKTVYTQTTSETKHTTDVTKTMTTETTLGELGVSTDSIFIGYEGSPTHLFLEFDFHNTVGDVLTALASYGIVATYYEGAIAISKSTNSTNPAYIIEGDTGELFAALGLEVGEDKTYNSLTETVYTQTTSETRHSNIENVKMNEDTTLSDLGLSGNQSIEVIDKDGVAHTISLSNSATVGDLLAELNYNGVNAYLVDGRIVIAESDSYISIGTTDLGTALGLPGLMGDENYKTTTTTTTRSNLGVGDMLTYSVEEYLTNNTTFGELGYMGVVIVNTRDPDTDEVKSNAILLAAENTINDFAIQLAAYGIRAGVDGNNQFYMMSVNNNSYIYGEQTVNGLDEALGIEFGEGKTYTSKTETVYSQTTSNTKHVEDFVHTMTSESTLGEINSDGGNILISFNDGSAISATFNTSNTVGDVLDVLASAGIGAHIKDGVLYLDYGNSGAYISSDTILSDLGYTFGDGYAETITEDVYKNDSITSQFTYDTTLIMTTETLFSDLGVSGSVGVNYNGKNYTVTMNENNSVGDLLTALAGFGVSGTITDGVLKLTGTDDGYITSIDSSLATRLKISSTATDYYDTSTETVYQNTTTNALHDREITITMTTDKTFAELGKTGGTISGYSNGQAFTVSVNANNTVDDLLTQLAAYGISGSVTNGVMTLKGSSEGYVTSISSELGFLGLPVGNDVSWDTSTDTYYKYSKSDEQTKVDTITMTNDTTFADLSSTGGVIQGVYNGENFSVTVGAEHSIDNLLTALAAYGISGTISNGKLTLQSADGTKITSIGSGISTALKLAVDTKEITDTTNDASNLIDKDRSDLQLTGDTILNKIDGLTGGQIAIHQTNGHFTTINIDSTDTLDEFFEQIAHYGLIGSVDTEGKVSITGVGDVYLETVSGGSNILSKLNLSDVHENYKTTTVNRTSDTFGHTVTVEATGTTALQNLIHDDGTGIGSDYKINLTTTSDAGNVTVTLDFTAGSTLYDVIDKLAEYGIDASIDSSGRFSMKSSSLTDFTIGGNLGEFLMTSTYTKLYDEGSIDNVSTNLVEDIVVDMDDSTLLSKLGITNGNYELYKDGTLYTLSIDNTKTVGDFRNELANYGITSEIINGKLQLIADGVVELNAMAGGSNIVTKMGLEDWDKGGYEQESKLLTDTDTIKHSATMDDKLSELTTADGTNSLGITDGLIYVYQDGSRFAVNIDTDDTLQDLANKLSQYGISMGISSDGKVYFDGNNNSYLAEYAGGSNILDKFNIKGDWNTRYNSTSETQDYEVTEVVQADGSTKLTDLVDDDGDKLGISEGNYYVYQNGVRSTETVDENTTVNDFLATMSAYGMTTNFDETGSLSVGGYNETYLATANTSEDDTNAISLLFTEWDFTNVYTSNNIEMPTDVTVAISATTKLADINVADPSQAYKAGYITVVKDGVQTDIQLTADATVGDLIDELAMFGFESIVNSNGELIIKNTGDSLLQAYSGAAAKSNALELLGIGVNDWIQTNNYSSKTLSTIKTQDQINSATRDTLLSELGVSTGEYYIYKDGVKYTAMISSDETLGSLMDTLNSFGIQTSLVDNGVGSVLTIIGQGNSYVAQSSNEDNVSNVVTKLFTNLSVQNDHITNQETRVIATEDTLLNTYDDGALVSEGDLSVTVDGVEHTIRISNTETIGSFIDKLEETGMHATYLDGKIFINNGTINVANSTSSVMANLKFLYDNSISGYAASTDASQQVFVSVVDGNFSVANYADENTTMNLLNITSGSLTIYKDGEKATIQIDSSKNFSDIQTQLNNRFGEGKVKLEFNDGYLTFKSSENGVNIVVGSTTDTSNFSAITGIQKNEDGIAESARELYCVNASSKLMTAGIFRDGNITAGTFKIGDATFTIKDDTTISDIVSQINATQDANATAYWDSIDAKLVIQSRTEGAALINIEAGTSNFTDVMGLTNSEWTNTDTDGDGFKDLSVTKMNVDAQTVGENARFAINGTYYTSTSNTIGSDVSKIEGLTINLKGVSEGETTLTVERDKETIANTVSEVVDAYNELIKNVDKEIAKGGSLDDQFTLKLVRNQIRNMMTGSIITPGVYKNLNSIGITVEKASANNIATDNVDTLYFDKDQFIKAFDADRDSLQGLLIGVSETDFGIFGELDRTLEKNITFSGGYFQSAENSYNKQISRLTDKIKKAESAVEKYRERLERKFSVMDNLISKIQNQYSSFLSA